METWRKRLRVVTDRAGELRSVDEKIRCYALMDMRAYPDLSEALWKDANTPSWRLWQGTDLESYEDLGPMLVEIDLDAYEKPESSNGSEQASETALPRCMARMEEDATGRYAITFILSPFDGEALAHHYRTYCEYNLSDGRGYYLHFYDARILTRLRMVWNSEQQCAFTSPVCELHYCERTALIGVWKNETPTRSASQQSPTMQILTLEQHQQLLRQDYPDKVALQLRRTYPRLLAGISHEVLYNKVIEQINRAHAHGVKAQRDLFDYVVCAVTTSDRFDEHPRILACLANIKSSQMSFADSLSEISDDMWDEISRAG